ncbi:MAG TPA: hypothetical protein PLB52_00335 [Candidatus Moranbacteria bacterium]|nr:hypothetical protein [Candidatus Moranbacteria bacterium]
MNNPEDKQLNQPTKNYFKSKFKCNFSVTEFKFSAGFLDVLAYNQNEKCFYISEGKRSGNVASIGHAVGQLIAYMSVIQEKGYEFLEKITQQERLELEDVSTFLENKAIRACFFVTLPLEKKDKLLPSAKLMLKNLGDFGSSIGVFFANSKKCELGIPAKPLLIKLRKIYTREQILQEILNKFLNQPIAEGLMENRTQFRHMIQIKEKIGNPFLHFEITSKKITKASDKAQFEIAFHVEFAKSHLIHDFTKKRRNKLLKIMKNVQKDLSKSDKIFKLKAKWGKNWSKLYNVYSTTNKIEFDQEDVNEILDRLDLLVSRLKPELDRINWGRIRNNEE